MSDSQRPPSYGPTPEREGDIATRLRALASSPSDPESLRRGLLWVAGEVQACEQALRQATDQVASVSSRLAVLEAREQATARATAGIDSFRREFVWLTGEVQARNADLTRTSDRVTALETRDAHDVRGELDRYATEVSGAADFAELARAALRSALLEGAVRELRDEMEKVTHDLLTNQQAAMAHVAGRTAPLEGALHELRRELDRVADESAATNHAVRTEIFNHVTALDQRLQGVEAIPSDLDGIYREVDRLSGHLSDGQGVLAEIIDRLRPLEDAVVAARQELLDARGVHPSPAARFDADEQYITGRLDALEGDITGRLGTVEVDVTHRLEWSRRMSSAACTRPTSSSWPTSTRSTTRSTGAWRGWRPTSAVSAGASTWSASASTWPRSASTWWASGSTGSTSGWRPWPRSRPTSRACTGSSTGWPS